ncbi:MAG TPA: hypothetical protein VFG58_05905 [Solirubrobacterales bacterium]|nr:hypothetical protein [Solirubrobacterales bacterium]
MGASGRPKCPRTRLEPLTLGETTFTFVTEGIESALARAREAAGERDVAIGGGARLFEDGAGAGLALESTLVVDTPEVTHLRYRVGQLPSPGQRYAARHTG